MWYDELNMRLRTNVYGFSVVELVERGEDVKAHQSLTSERQINMEEKVMQGKPYAGNPCIRFDEGADAPKLSRRSALLNKIHCVEKIFRVVVLVALVVLIALQTWHLSCEHFDDDQRKYQAELLSDIQKKLDVFQTEGNTEELVKNMVEKLNSHDPIFFPKESVRTLQTGKRGRYCVFDGKRMTPADWKIYEIDSPPYYSGYLEIGYLDGHVEEARIVYEGWRE